MIDVLRRARRHALFELVLLLITALGLALCVQAYAVKPYRIPSESMLPALHNGDRVLVDRFSHRLLSARPHIGQVIVFHPPAGAGAMPATCGNPAQGGESRTPCSRPTAKHSTHTFVKRVVGLEGDRISVRGGHVVRNGKLQREPFAAPCGQGGGCDFPVTIAVPKNSVYLLGDNRGNSDDSRYWGPVPIGWVIGRAVAIYWPPGRVGAP